MTYGSSPSAHAARISASARTWPISHAHRPQRRFLRTRVAGAGPRRPSPLYARPAASCAAEVPASCSARTSACWAAARASAGCMRGWVSHRSAARHARAGRAEEHRLRDDVHLRLPGCRARPPSGSGEPRDDGRSARREPRETLAKVLANAPLAIRAMKQATQPTLDLPYADAVTRARAILGEVMKSDDAREGLAADARGPPAALARTLKRQAANSAIIGHRRISPSTHHTGHSTSRGGRMDLGLKGKVVADHRRQRRHRTGDGAALCDGRRQRRASCARRAGAARQGRGRSRRRSACRCLPSTATRPRTWRASSTRPSSASAASTCWSTTPAAPARIAFDKVDDKAWRDDIEVKLFAPIDGARCVVPHMKKQGGGRIIKLTMAAATHARRAISCRPW